MIDRNPTNPGTDFARSLLDAGKSEQPPAGATARVLRRVAGAGTATGSASVLAAKGAWSVAAVATLAAAAGVAVFLEHGAPDTADRAPSTVATTTPTTAASPPSQTSQPSPARQAAARATTACERVDLPDHEPTVCSVPGHRERIEVVNTCADDVDLFWIDYKCRESFVGRVAPGQQLGQTTYDTHPWRVRDHATHRLVKEWVGPAQPEAPKDPVELPEVAIDDGSSAPEAPPSVCSRPGNGATLRVVDRRTSGVSTVFWVDFDCHEQVFRRLEPGETWVESTFDTHPWRVRDENGRLLVDFVPEGIDQTVYVSLP
jgi:hypothetical protein